MYSMPLHLSISHDTSLLRLHEHEQHLGEYLYLCGSLGIMAPRWRLPVLEPSRHVPTSSAPPQYFSHSRRNHQNSAMFCTSLRRRPSFSQVVPKLMLRSTLELIGGQ